MFGGFFLQARLDSIIQGTHRLDACHRDVERSIRRLNVSQGKHNGRRTDGRGSKGTWKDEIH